MKKQLLKQLIEESYTKDQLDEKKVLKIAQALNRKQLKVYITGLKNRIKKETIYVDSATELNTNIKDEIASEYKDKQIVYRVMPELLVGLRIKVGDDFYRLNIHDRLEDLKQFITE